MKNMKMKHLGLPLLIGGALQAPQRQATDLTVAHLTAANGELAALVKTLRDAVVERDGLLAEAVTYAEQAEAVFADYRQAHALAKAEVAAMALKVAERDVEVAKLRAGRGAPVAWMVTTPCGVVEFSNVFTNFDEAQDYLENRTIPGCYLTELFLPSGSGQ